MKLLHLTLGLVVESGRGVDQSLDRLRQVRGV